MTTRAWTDTSRAIFTGFARALPIALTICAALVAPARAEASGAASTTAAPGPFSAALLATAQTTLTQTTLAAPPAATFPTLAAPGPFSAALVTTAQATLTPSPATAAAAVPETTSATIAPSLSPNRPGARGALTLTVHYAGGEHGVPAPVRRSAMSLPAGLTFDVPSLRSCGAALLRAKGPAACPPQSLVGRGHALGEALTGSEVVQEEAIVWAFIGPPSGNNPTIELVGEGTAPVPTQVIVTGTVVPARPPYGEQLVIPIPPIPSLPGGSDASLVNLTLTLGTPAAHPPPSANTIVLPPRCPIGGYPFAAAFTYADGATGNAAAKVPCPARVSRSPGHGPARHHRRGHGRTAAGRRSRGRGQTAARQRSHGRNPTTAGRRSHDHSQTAARRRVTPPRARAARTVSLQESGSLHLISKRGFTLNEQGSASGTFSGAIHVRLTIASTNRVRAEVSISRGGGSIAGVASANYRRGSSSASFAGSLSIDGGTGSYSHARGSGLSFSGTIQNSNDAIAVHLSGPISD